MLKTEFQMEISKVILAYIYFKEKPASNRTSVALIDNRNHAIYYGLEDFCIVGSPHSEKELWNRFCYSTYANVDRVEHLDASQSSVIKLP